MRFIDPRGNQLLWIASLSLPVQSMAAGLHSFHNNREYTMRRIAIALPLLLLSGWAAAQEVACDALAKSAPQSAVSNRSAPVAPGLTASRSRLGAPSGVLAQALDDAQSVDNVLLRITIDPCQNVAARKKKKAPEATPAPSTAASDAVIDPATYKPKTAHDNTPYRFDMNQNGKRMTAEEFDAWMKARGVRVAKGAPAKPAADAVVDEKTGK